MKRPMFLSSASWSAPIGLRRDSEKAGEEGGGVRAEAADVALEAVVVFEAEAVDASDGLFASGGGAEVEERELVGRELAIEADFGAVFAEGGAVGAGALGKAVTEFGAVAFEGFEMAEPGGGVGGEGEAEVLGEIGVGGDEFADAHAGEEEEGTVGDEDGVDEVAGADVSDAGHGGVWAAENDGEGAVVTDAFELAAAVLGPEGGEGVRHGVSVCAGKAPGRRAEHN